MRAFLALARSYVRSIRVFLAILPPPRPSACPRGGWCAHHSQHRSGFSRHPTDSSDASAWTASLNGLSAAPEFPRPCSLLSSSAMVSAPTPRLWACTAAPALTGCRSWVPFECQRPRAAQSCCVAAHNRHLTTRMRPTMVWGWLQNLGAGCTEPSAPQRIWESRASRDRSSREPRRHDPRLRTSQTACLGTATRDRAAPF